ncbi:glycosyltransferase family 4 protein [Actinomycetota bacterium]|nr:glycosyltransferase family 4 protein [Actinomycetota bacterium]
MRVAMDEQIFAIQRYGGISRLFYELAKQFTTTPDLGVELLPISAPIVNQYVLDNPDLTAALRTHPAKNSISALATYFSHRTDARGAQIVHNTFYLPHGLTGGKGARRIVTIHDMIPELLPKTRRRLDLLTMKRRYVHQADHIICVSAATRGDLVRLYPEITAPISVVHHGVDPVFTPDILRWSDLPERYILFVGNRDQYKDADILMKAFAAFAKEFTETTLLFVGGGDFTTKEIKLMHTLGITQRVSQRSLPDAEMSSAYCNAIFTVFPSRFEGFGLPALESMASGTATILANSTSLPEVGGEAALYFESGNVSDLAEKMLDLATNPQLRGQLAKAGIYQAQGFSWAKCATETASVYQATLNAN